MTKIDYWIKKNCGGVEPQFDWGTSEWRYSKEELLAKLFGIDDLAAALEASEDYKKSPLIIRFPVEYTASYGKLLKEYWDIVDEDPIYRQFLTDYMDIYGTVEDDEWGSELLLPSSFVRNKPIYSDGIENNFDKRVYHTPSGKVIKVYPQDKWSKVFRKLMRETTAWDDETAAAYEKFLQRLSTIGNSKEIKGTMCLSIHPLDYMTMSDNDCNWTSCMSWANNGSYRAGTIEMMNSRYVIVAYLDAETPFNLGGGRQWSNKKWRELFIYQGNFISEVKAYPYENEGLTKIVINKLIEMSKKINPTASWSDIGYTKNTDWTKYPNNDPIEISFATGAMYNDIEENDDPILFAYDTNTKLPKSITYSGARTCMICGEDMPDEAEEGLLVCEFCPIGICPECGEPIYQTNAYRMGPDRQRYCKSCWGKKFFCDDLDYSTQSRSNAVILKIDIHEPMVAMANCFTTTRETIKACFEMDDIEKYWRNEHNAYLIPPEDIPPSHYCNRYSGPVEEVVSSVCCQCGSHHNRHFNRFSAKANGWFCPDCYPEEEFFDDISGGISKTKYLIVASRLRTHYQQSPYIWTTIGTLKKAKYHYLQNPCNLQEFFYFDDFSISPDIPKTYLSEDKE